MYSHIIYKPHRYNAMQKCTSVCIHIIIPIIIIATYTNMYISYR